MEIHELKVGDILLFSPEKGSFISWAITFLTDAPVSHAAMFYSAEKQSIIEETPPQVKVNFAAERFKDREIYVRRLNDTEGLPLTPVIECAANYLNDEEPYGNGSLYIVGLLLIYRKFTLNTPVQKSMIKILKKLTSSITTYINERKYPGKLPMVCSQFVAQCYDDAGDKYRLNIESGILRKAAAPRHADGNVLDQVMEIVQSGSKGGLQTVLAPAVKIQEDAASGEELCRELKNAFALTAVAMTPGITDELVEAVSQFSHAHYLLSSGGTELHSTGTDVAMQFLQHLKNNENMYVFPGDLLKHCTNVRDVGKIH